MSYREIPDGWLEFNTRWLERNGDVKCACGHAYRQHLADLSGCADCNTFEPVHLRCEGFDLVRKE